MLILGRAFWKSQRCSSCRIDWWLHQSTEAVAAVSPRPLEPFRESRELFRGRRDVSWGRGGGNNRELSTLQNHRDVVIIHSVPCHAALECAEPGLARDFPLILQRFHVCVRTRVHEWGMLWRPDPDCSTSRAL